MRTTIAKWDDGLALRLPHSIAEQMHVHEGSAVELTVTEDRLTVSPARSRYTLDDLLASATPENSGGEVDWGDAEGKEDWSAQ